MSWREGYVAVDWGTTNRRAYCVDAGGKVTDRVEDDRGILAMAGEDFGTEVDALSERFGGKPLLLAGMIGSNRGWYETAYVDCPAGDAEIAAGILWMKTGRIGIVPGVCQRGAAGADVMRGEEVQALGAVAAGLVPPDPLICHPGTHAKWIRMRNGAIAGFRSAMTGELFNLLRRHSILADQLAGEVVPGDSFAAGVSAALEGGELLHALFSVRARRLLDEGPSDAAYVSGLLIGSDIRAGLMVCGDQPVTLVGAPDLCRMYAAALAAAGRDTTEIDGEVAFLGGIRRLTELL